MHSPGFPHVMPIPLQNSGVAGCSDKGTERSKAEQSLWLLLSSMPESFSQKTQKAEESAVCGVPQCSLETARPEEGHSSAGKAQLQSSYSHRCHGDRRQTGTQGLKWPGHFEPARPPDTVSARPWEAATNSRPTCLLPRRLANAFRFFSFRIIIQTSLLHNLSH